MQRTIAPGEPMELYMKVTVTDQAKLQEWAARIHRVDEVSPEVAASLLASSLVAPFTLAGGDQALVRCQFVGRPVEGSRKGPRRKGGARLCVVGES